MGKRHEGSLVQKAGQNWRRERGRDSELDHLPSVGAKDAEAAAKSARFGVHFTPMYSFSAISLQIYHQLTSPSPISIDIFVLYLPA